MSAIPPPIGSLFRGQANNGMGEPEGDVRRGEQYLAVTSERLRNKELWRAFRPWMTFDVDPADNQRVGGRLEGWACFSYRDVVAVARLRAAAPFTDRDAYFSHARAWSLDDVHRGFDPGSFLGVGGAFHQPWRDRTAPEEPVLDPRDALPDTGLLTTEADTAKRLVARLFQARVTGRSLVVVAPVGDFADGSRLPRLWSFARMALPADLRKTCSVRSYAYRPSRFLDELQAGLLVVTEAALGELPRDAAGSLLVDRQGNLLSRTRAEPEYDAYGEIVVERAQQLPGALLAFGERFAAHRTSGPPTREDLNAAAVTYNLAHALEQGDEVRGSLLETYLPHLDVDWNRWVEPSEWGTFPRESLKSVALRVAEGTERRLQAVVEEHLVGQATLLDDRVDSWMREGDHKLKLRRLVELYDRAVPLVAPEIVSRYTRDEPVGRLAATGHLAAILAAEARIGDLRHRERQASGLAEAAADSAVFDALADATSLGKLSHEWAEMLLREPTELGTLAERLLRHAERWDAWGLAPDLLLEHLLAAKPPWPLPDALHHAASQVEPSRYPARLASLAELLARIPGHHHLREVADAVHASMPALSGTMWQRMLVDRWRLVDYLSTEELLEAGSELNEAAFEALVAVLDTRLDRDTPSVTTVLVTHGAWMAWRRASRLEATTLRQVALAWLRNHPTDTDPRREEWRRVMADVGEIDHELMDELCGEETTFSERQPRFPLIPAFEDDQICELARAAADVDGLLTLSTLILGQQVLATRFDDPYGSIAESSSFAAILPARILERLAGRLERRGSLTLTVAQSAHLVRRCHADDVRRRALDIHGDNVLRRLDDTASATVVEEAELRDVGLVLDQTFLNGLARWLVNRWRTQLSIDIALLTAIDEQLPADAKHENSETSVELVELARDRGLHRLARFLGSSGSDTGDDGLFANIVTSLLLPDSAARESWGTLGSRIANGREKTHPLEQLAFHIEDRKLDPTRAKDLEARGLEAFLAAAEKHEVLFSTDSYRRLPALAVARALTPAGGLGLAAIKLLRARDGQRPRTDWLEALLRSIPHYCTPRDRATAALALVTAALHRRRSSEASVADLLKGSGDDLRHCFPREQPR